MTIYDELEEIRDLLRTSLPPSCYTMDAWNQHKCERAASVIDRLIKRHNDTLGGTKEERAKKREERRQMKLRDQYRNTVCAGCYNNRYNYESAGDRLNAPTSGKGCWSLMSIRRGICPSRPKYR